MQASVLHSISSWLKTPVQAAPLAVFRVLFGAVMALGTLRFWAKGWIGELYVEPDFHFTYWGFGWIKPLGEVGMYLVFALMFLSFVMVALGWKYRLASVSAFALFTYVELIDKTNYLNHYYFVSIVCFLLILLPANRFFSIDAMHRPEIRSANLPRWQALAIPLQLGLVYFFAGIAKLNPDWMLEAMPLKVWLPAHADLPLIGALLTQDWVAYAFSWFGAIYDLSIPFLLAVAATRKWAYGFVIVFHICTWLLFPIGMFPWIMMLSTLVFFPAAFHLGLIERFNRTISWIGVGSRTLMTRQQPPVVQSSNARFSKVLATVLIAHFALQLLLPMRHVLYPGELFWNEEGYRFSWRVMLMEKSGAAWFYVLDPQTGQQIEVDPSEYLTAFQEKQMVTQPDMILQFAHHLDAVFQLKGIANPEVRVRSYANLNGAGSTLFIDPTIDLSQQHDNLAHKEWVLPRSTTNLALR